MNRNWNPPQLPIAVHTICDAFVHCICLMNLFKMSAKAGDTKKKKTDSKPAYNAEIYNNWPCHITYVNRAEIAESAYGPITASPIGKYNVWLAIRLSGLPGPGRTILQYMFMFMFMFFNRIQTHLSLRNLSWICGEFTVNLRCF